MNIWLVAGIALVFFILGWKARGFVTSLEVALKMMHGDLFIFSKGKWYPHNPRDGYLTKIIESKGETK